MNERDRDEFLNEPGDLFVQQCQELWNKLWEISNDGGQSHELRAVADALRRYLELPELYDQGTVAERAEIDSALIVAWKAITQPLKGAAVILPEARSVRGEEAVRCARSLIEAFPAMDDFSLKEHALLGLSFRVCADMAWQLPKPPRERQPRFA